MSSSIALLNECMGKAIRPAAAVMVRAALGAGPIIQRGLVIATEEYRLKAVREHR